MKYWILLDLACMQTDSTVFVNGRESCTNYKLHNEIISSIYSSTAKVNKILIVNYV